MGGEQPYAAAGVGVNPADLLNMPAVREAAANLADGGPVPAGTPQASGEFLPSRLPPSPSLFARA